MRVHHQAGRSRNRGMLGGIAVGVAKQENIAGRERLAVVEFVEMPPRSLGERLKTRRLGPVARVGGRHLRLAAMDRAPHPAHKAEAVAADPVQRRLMTVGRANPGTRLGDDAGAGG